MDLRALIKERVIDRVIDGAIDGVIDNVRDHCHFLGSIVEQRTAFAIQGAEVDQSSLQ